MRKFNLVPTTIEEAERYAKIISSSSMCPKQYFGKPIDAFVAMQWGMELGIHPLQALQNISIINGKPSLWGDAILAIVQNHKDCKEIIERVENIDDELVATCIVKRRNQDEVTTTTITFTESDAKKAGLWNKQGPWTLYPKRMLQMRARAFALRNSFADALMGISVAEEAQDIEEQPNSKTEKLLKSLSDNQLNNEKRH